MRLGSTKQASTTLRQRDATWLLLAGAGLLLTYAFSRFEWIYADERYRYSVDWLAPVAVLSSLLLIAIRWLWLRPIHRARGAIAALIGPIAEIGVWSVVGLGALVLRHGPYHASVYVIVAGFVWIAAWSWCHAPASALQRLLFPFAAPLVMVGVFVAMVLTIAMMWAG